MAISAYAALLQCCGHVRSLIDGQIIHDQIIRHVTKQNAYILNCLGYMYGHCGALQEACAVFTSMHATDVFSWNFLIRAHALHGHAPEALQLLHQMNCSGVSPDRFSFISILSSTDNQSEGMLIHTFVIEYHLDKDILVGNVLVKLYGKCGLLEDAVKVFELMPRRDLVSWNSLISSCMECRELETAILVFEQMQHQSVKPDRVTFITLLSAAGDGAALREGKCLHAVLVGTEFVMDTTVGNALLNMYGKCGILDDTCNTFNGMLQKDIISWNSMLTAFVINGEGMEVLHVYRRLQLQGLLPNTVSLICVLDACACQEFLVEGKRMHASIMHTVSSLDTVLGTAVVHMYGKCNSLEDACKAFDCMPKRNLLSWNTLAAACSQQGPEVMAMLGRMHSEAILPDNVSYVAIISACTNHKTSFHGKLIHACAFASLFWGDVVVGTSLVHMYGKFGHLEKAEKVFCKLVAPNVVSWNAIISVYAQHEQYMKVHQLSCLMYLQALLPDKVTFISILSAYASEEALMLGKQTHTRIASSELEMDVLIANGLVNMYGECGVFHDAQRVFENMVKRNVSSWNALIHACVQTENGSLSLEMFHRMQWEGMTPDKVTFLGLLNACTMEVASEGIRRLHTCFMSSCLQLDTTLGSAFINTYGKSGELQDALRVFHDSPKNEADTWNAMISAYAQTGHGNECLSLFFSMQHRGVVPTTLTFVSVLCGCSHAGLIVEGCHCFLLLLEESHIKPKAEHYNCMVDLHARAGKVDVAEALLRIMPYEPNITAVLILLSACRCGSDLKRGEYFANVAFRLDPTDPTPYIMLWNIYSTATEVVN